VSLPRVGVGCVVRRGGSELLLVRRSGGHGNDTWSTPGGKLDFGESPAACAVRETEEETGVRVWDPRFLGYTNDVFEPEGLHFVTLWFEADHLEGEAELKAPDEHSEIGWFRQEHLPAPLFAPFLRLLDGEFVR